MHKTQVYEIVSQMRRNPKGGDAQSKYESAPLFWSSTNMSLNSISAPSMFCRTTSSFGVLPL
jgi:hypothetical protein